MSLAPYFSAPCNFLRYPASLCTNVTPIEILRVDSADRGVGGRRVNVSGAFSRGTKFPGKSPVFYCPQVDV